MFLRCCLIVMFLLCVQNGWSDERSERIRPTIEKYVEQTTINNLLKTVGEVFERVIRTQNLQVLPQVSYQATQQTVLQIFKQQDLLDFIRDAYQQSVDAGMESFENNDSQQQIQDIIRSTNESAIRPIVEDRYFQHLVKEMLKNAMKQSQALVSQVAVQQYVQKATVQRAAMQQAIIAQYKQMIQALALQNAQMQYQQQFQNSQAQLQQQYLQEQERLRQQQLLLQQQGY